MVVLHLLYAGGTGGIEKLCKDIGLHSKLDDNIFMFVHQGGIICSEMKDAGIEVIELGIQNYEIIRLAKVINGVLIDRCVDCVVIHHPAPLIWIAVLIVQMKNIKLFVYAHNNYLEIVEQKKWKRIIYNALLEKCNRIIAISDSVKKSFLKENPIKKEKIFVVYNGIEISAYQSEPKVKDDGVIRLIYVGRLIREKGVQVLIEALSELENKRDFRLDIIGDGNYRKPLEELVHKLDLGSIVRFEGIQRNVHKYLSNSDVFIHPAIWEEGFGITIIEAMSAGLICVAFRKGAIPEIIEDNVSGFIINDCSSKGLAAALDEIRKRFNDGFLLDIRRNAVARASIFSIENVVEELHNVYIEG